MNPNTDQPPTPASAASVTETPETDRLYDHPRGERTWQDVVSGFQELSRSLERRLHAAESRLAEIDAGAQADEADLQKMRDGTKLTRAGLVQIIVYLQQDVRAAEAELEWLEAQAKASPTGISFDYCRHVEDGYLTEKGFRFMRKHFLGERRDTLRAAITAAMNQTK